MSIASCAEVVLAAAGQRVGLVDQQDAAEGLLDDLRRLDRGLADVAGDEVRAVGLDELPLLTAPSAAIDLGEQAGDRGLARARIAGEHEMQADVDDRQLTFGAHRSGPGGGW